MGDTRNDPLGKALFKTDCEISIFSAKSGNIEIGQPFSVNVYPRRADDGFNWLVWECREPGFGESFICAGGTCRSTDRAEAIQEGVAELMKAALPPPRNGDG